MDFLTFLHRHALPWALGDRLPDASALAARDLATALLRDVTRQVVDAIDRYRRHQMTLTERLTQPTASPIGSIWRAISAPLPQITPLTGPPLDDGIEEVATRWSALHETWPTAITLAIEASPEVIANAMSGLPEIIAQRFFISLAGMAFPESIGDEAIIRAAETVRAQLPPSVAEDDGAMGRFQLRALQLATWLGDMGQETADLDAFLGAAPQSEQAQLTHLSHGVACLYRAVKEDRPQPLRSVLPPLEHILRALDFPTQADAIARMAVSAALTAREPDDACGWLHQLALHAIAESRYADALRLQKLRAVAARHSNDKKALRGDALRRAAELALVLEDHAEALALLRAEAALQDAEGDAELGGLAWLNLAKVFSSTETWEDALQTAGEAETRLTRLGTLGLARQAQLLQAEALLKLGRLDDADTRLERARRSAEAEGETELCAALAERLAELRAGQEGRNQ